MVYKNVGLYFLKMFSFLLTFLFIVRLLYGTNLCLWVNRSVSNVDTICYFVVWLLNEESQGMAKRECRGLRSDPNSVNFSFTLSLDLVSYDTF